MEQTKYDVFISYSWNDIDIAKEIYDAIVNSGLKCCFDKETFPGGGDFPKITAENICNSEIFLYLGSKSSYTSGWAPDEVAFAKKHKPRGKLLYYAIDNNTMPIWIDLAFAAINRRNIFEHPYNSILIEDIKTMLCGTAPRDDEKYICMCTLKHRDSVESAHFCSKESNVVTASNDDYIYLWDADNGKCLNRLKGHEESVNCASYSPDGKLIVSASDDETIRIWNAITGKCIKIINAHDDSIWTAFFSSNGKHIVSASVDECICIWDASTGCLLQRLLGHTDTVNYAVFSPNCQYVVSASDDETIRIWNTETGECCRILYGHSDGVWYRNRKMYTDIRRAY